MSSVVENNLTSAVIFEDDMDWDLRIKQVCCLELNPRRWQLLNSDSKCTTMP